MEWENRKNKENSINTMKTEKEKEKNKQRKSKYKESTKLDGGNNSKKLSDYKT